MEQKYKSALEAARKLHECYCNNKEQRKMIELIFPELEDNAIDNDKLKARLIDEITTSICFWIDQHSDTPLTKRDHYDIRHAIMAYDWDRVSSYMRIKSPNRGT